MIKGVTSNNTNTTTILISDMEPYDIGIITSGYLAGQYVIRTANVDTVEIMNLTEPAYNSSWLNYSGKLTVRLLPPGDSITLTVK